MKRRSICLWGGILAMAPLFLPGPSMAQEVTGPIILPPPYLPTVVSVMAADAVATEPGAEVGPIDHSDPAAFAVYRDTHLELDLVVFYRLDGTAANGKDYEALTSEVLIPAGQHAARIVVQPLADGEEEGVEEVRLTILPPVCIAIYPPPPECYTVGRPESAVVYIRDSADTPINRPPRAEIVRPSDGDVFKLGEAVPVEIVTRDPDGYAPRVALYADGAVVAEGSIEFIMAPPPGEPIHFELTWESPPPGPHVLRALTTDNQGAEGWSEPVVIHVDGLPELPEVNVVATDPEAAEPDAVPPDMERPLILDTGTFTVTRRGGGVQEPLTVFFLLGGTARNGEDYEMIPWTVTIPAGAEEARVEVLPLDDDQPEGKETVELLLIQPPLLGPVESSDGSLPGFYPVLTYRIGPHDHDTVVIVDNDGDVPQPPRVAIVRPESGTTFLAPATIALVAKAADLDGEVEQVEFFANGESLGLGIPVDVLADEVDARYFRFTWTEVPVGGYRLVAVATDQQGLQGESEPVLVKVTDDVPPPDVLPVVRIRARDPVGSERADFGGTPTITFRIFRQGVTEESLTVYLHIGGSAVNGKDYERIPMTATIPAGFEGVDVMVTPIDDEEPERAECVVLTLALPPTDPAAFMAPPYLIGHPGRTGALILDNDHDRDHCIRLEDGTFHLCRDPDGAHCFRIEASDDMRHWEVLTDQSVSDGALHYVDPDGPLHPRRFYRVRPILCPIGLH